MPSARRRSRWDPEALHCTRAYSEWQVAERYLRTFLRLGAKFATDAYAARWAAVVEAVQSDFVRTHDPLDDQVENLIKVGEQFDASVENLHPIDFDRLLLDLGVRDGLTLFEVYLEKAIHEFVGRKVHETKMGERSPDWEKVARVYRAVLGVDPYPPPVREVTALRNLLTHRRGELVTDKLREKYATEVRDIFQSYEVPLSAEIVTGHLDTLAQAAARVDAVVWPLAWGNTPVDHALRDSLLLHAPWLWATE
jgi:hypothetical protein